MDLLTTTLANNLRRLREERGLTQESLAELAGVSNMTVYRIEAGERWSSPKVLNALASALGVESPDFFAATGEDGEPPHVSALRVLAHHLGFRLVRA